MWLCHIGEVWRMPLQCCSLSFQKNKLPEKPARFPAASTKLPGVLLLVHFIPPSSCIWVCWWGGLAAELSSSPTFKQLFLGSEWHFIYILNPCLPNPYLCWSQSTDASVSVRISKRELHKVNIFERLTPVIEWALNSLENMGNYIGG